MPAKSSSSKIITLIILIPALLLLWILAPYALPVWRWMNVDWEAQAKLLGVPRAQLEKPFKMVVRHGPRGPNDPIPWQIVTCEPLWNSIYPDAEIEEDTLIRCTMVNDGTGQPPSQMLVGSGSKRDAFFTVTAWRFKPGSFGLNAKRPVVVYDGQSIEKTDATTAISLDTAIRGKYKPAQTNDDKWEARDDGFLTTTEP